MVYEPNECVTDVIYVIRDETNTMSFSRIVSDARANFFPEDYQHQLHSTTLLFDCEVYNNVTEIETTTACTQTTTAGTQTPTMSSTRSKRNRVRHLEACDVRYIWSLRKHKVSKTAGTLATRYGVTSKAIRDIWTGKTWRYLL